MFMIEVGSALASDLAPALSPAHRDVITTGGQVVIALLVYMGIRQEFGIRRTRKGQKAAERAVQLSEPTGNGYARRTDDKLDSIAGGLDSLALEVRGLRTDHRDLSRRVDRNSIRLDRHIDPERNNT